jgi:hypothetical protein
MVSNFGLGRGIEGNRITLDSAGVPYLDSDNVMIYVSNKLSLAVRNIS